MWSYTDFPVTPDSTPLAGNGDVVLASQANGLREAIVRRADLIGASVSIPDEVADLDVCYLSWLIPMRAAVEALLAENRYGRFRREYIDPNWTNLFWEPWTKETVLQRVHADFISNALITDPADWMQAAAEGDLPGAEPDPSIMYASHINELYYVLEFLCYVELAPSLALTALSADAAYGFGDGPGPEWDWASMLEAYNEGWAVFNAGGYSPGWADEYANAHSHLCWDEWAGQHAYYVDDRRARDVRIVLPSQAYPATELAVPFQATAADSMMAHWPDMFECWMGADFTGDANLLRLGDITTDWAGNQAFSGWLAWDGIFAGGPLSFSYRWPEIASGQWGGPYIHDDYLSAYLSGWTPAFGGFYFDGYRNGAWQPIHGGEWSVFFHW